jgi:MFS family permease
VEQPEPETRLLNRNLVHYLGGWAVFAFSGQGLMSVLLNLYMVRLGFSTGSIGVMAGANSLAWGLCSLPAAIFVRRFGLRNSLMAGALSQAIAVVAMLSVELLPREVWTAWLFFWWIALGVGFSPIAVSGAPLLMQVSPPHLRRQAVVLGISAFAGSLIAGQLPAFFAPLLSASVDQPAPYRAALALAPLSNILITFLWSRMRLAPLAPAVSQGSHDRRPTGLLVFIVVMVFLQASAEGGLRAFFNLYLDRQLLTPVALIGLISAVAQIGSVAASLLIPTVLQRAGNAGTLGAVSFGIAVCMVAIAGVPSLAVAAAGYIVAMSLVGIGIQVRHLFGQELVASHWRTNAASVNQVGIGLGASGAAAAGGLLIGAAGFAGVFGIGAAFSLAAATSLAVFSAARRRASPPTA